MALKDCMQQCSQQRFVLFMLFHAILFLFSYISFSVAYPTAIYL